jgi:hypothetical protein
MSIANFHNDWQDLDLTRPTLWAREVWATCRSQREVAEKVGVTEFTVSTWMRDPEFRAAVREVERASLTAAVGDAQRLASAAIRTIASLLDDENPRVRLVPQRRQSCVSPARPHWRSVTTTTTTSWMNA